MDALTATRTLLDGELHHDVVVVVDGPQIIDVTDHIPSRATHVPLPASDLVPGLVDLHSDCLEEKMHPRPSARIPLPEALLELDTELVAHGITTHYLCIGLLAEEGEGRTFQSACQILTALARLKPHLRVDHRVHLRVDVASPITARAEELLGVGEVHLMSYMDHTPGQGQYPDIDRWREAMKTFLPPGGPSVEEVLDQKLSMAEVAEANRAVVADIAHRHQVLLASHDDDSVERVEQAVSFGAVIAEFPVTAEALKAATAAEGLGTVMGSPNARRGTSHSGNLSAREAITLGGLDALASDYHPPSLLTAAYLLEKAGVCTLAEGLALVSTGPARICGATDRGLIARGQRADLVAVHPTSEITPQVRQTWIAGTPAFGG